VEALFLFCIEIGVPILVIKMQVFFLDNLLQEVEGVCVVDAGHLLEM